MLGMSPFSNPNFTKNARTEYRVFKIVVSRCFQSARYENRKYLSRGNSFTNVRMVFIPPYTVTSHTQRAACFNELHFFPRMCVWGKIKTHNSVWLHLILACLKMCCSFSLPTSAAISVVKKRELRNCYYMRSVKQCVEPIFNATKGNSFL